ncbi:ATP-binding protein [Micromonosporaceae bacterium Da 78-11]
MLLQLSWRLPRTPPSVAMLRRVLDHTLDAAGVADDCRYDITLALTEACTNAVEHARTGDDYQVTLTADGERCSVEVVDSGVGLRADHERPPTTVTALRGRGLKIIRACTDSMGVDVLEPHGLAVRFSKKLVWKPGVGEAFLTSAA